MSDFFNRILRNWEWVNSNESLEMKPAHEQSIEAKWNKRKRNRSKTKQNRICCNVLRKNTSVWFCFDVIPFFVTLGFENIERYFYYNQPFKYSFKFYFNANFFFYSFFSQFRWEGINLCMIKRHVHSTHFYRMITKNHGKMRCLCAKMKLKWLKIGAISHWIWFDVSTTTIQNTLLLSRINWITFQVVPTFSYVLKN